MKYKSQFRKIDPYDWFCGPGFYKRNKKVSIDVGYFPDTI